MQIIKLTVIVVDMDGIGADCVKDAIENASYSNRCIAPEVKSIDVRDIGVWSDTHPLNKTDTVDDELHRLFGA